MLRLKLIACKAFYREFSLLTSTSKNYVDVTYIRQGLHDTPELLNKALKDEIMKVDSGNDIHSTKPKHNKDYDAIILGYGLCSNGITGLKSDKYTIVVPRTDDCIALYLGSYKKYLEQQKKNEGTYWYNASWIENAYTPSEENQKALYCEYKEKYGKENAKYLLDSILSIKSYSRAAYVSWPELSFPEHEKYTENAAKYYKWEYEKVKGDKNFLKDLIEGNWDEERFLVVPPKMEIIADFNGKVIDKK